MPASDDDAHLPSEATCIVDINDTLDEVERAMSALGRCVAAVTSNGRLVGFVSARTLLADIEASMELLRAGQEIDDTRTIGSLLGGDRATLVA